MIEIQAPTNCPSCSSVLEWSNQLLYCRNGSCPARSGKWVEHFAKTLKIKGLGPAAIDKLGLTSPSDIYQLSSGDIAAALNSTLLADKLFAEIEKSRSAPANLVLPALSIPLIGKTATAKLSTVVDHLYDLDTDSCLRAGLGPKATENLLGWLENALNADFWNSLPFDLTFEKPKAAVQKSNGVVCISGKLSSYSTKAEATQALESAGYAVKSTITKDVTILVNESGVESAKTKKARASGIQIVSNLNDFLGE